MNKKFTNVYSLFGLLFCAYIFISFSSNAPNNLTGAPPNNNTCQSGNGGCHFGGNFSGSVSITGLPGTIEPNTTYSITTTVSAGSGLPNRAGFQTVALDGSNANVGIMANPSASSTLTTDSGRTFHEHQPAVTFGASTSVSWTVDWTSPSGPPGENITFYACGNIANGSGTSGDDIVTGSISGVMDGGGGALTVSIINSSNVTCNGLNNGSATADATGGDGPPYSYNWQNSVPATVATGPNATNLPADTYTVIVTDSGGNSGSETVEITEPPALGVAIVAQTNVTCINPIGSATANASGGTPGYIYNWSNGGSGPTVPVMAGIQSVTATDANGCTSTTTVNILDDTTPPTVTILPPPILNCFSPIATLSGSGSSVGANFSYVWTTVGGNITSGATTLFPTISAGGTYTLTVLNSQNGCTNMQSVTVSQDFDNPIALGGANMSLNCTVTSVSLNGTSSSAGPQFSYLWTTANGNIMSGATTMTPVVNQSGVYTLTVTNNNNGCTSTDEVTVTEDFNPPTADAGPDMELTCDILTLTLDGSGSSQGGNFSILWTGPNIKNGATTLTPSVCEAGLYEITITNLVNGCTTSDIVEVTNDTTAPTADAGPDMELDCQIASVILDASNSSPSGNLSFAWSTTNGNILAGANTSNPEVTASGIYTVLVTNNLNGCTSTDDAVVTENVNLPTAEAGPDMVLDCNVLSVVLTGSGSSVGANFSYVWTTTTGNIVSGGNTLTPTVDAAGIYCIEVTDLTNGCISMDCVQVTQSIDPPTVLISPTTVINCLNACVTIDAGNSSTGPEFSYNWTGPNIVSGGNTLTPEVCAGGLYILEITNLSNGCVNVGSITVAEDVVSPIADAGSGATLNCNNVVVTLDGQNSSQGANYSYQWSGPDVQAGGTTLTPSVGAVGTYNLVVTNTNNGCTEESSTTVDETPLPTASITAQTNVDCNGNSTGTATAEGASGNPGYTYAWSSGGTEMTENDLPAGLVTVTITDMDGCTATANTEITEPDILLANVTSTNVSSAGATDGTATANPSGGTMDYTYNWSNGGDTQTIEDLEPDNYTVTVTDANGCQVVETVTVNSFDCGNVSLSFDVVEPSCNGSFNGSASVNVNNGSQPITFMWDTGSQEQGIFGIPAGTYMVTVTDGSNCEVSATVIVEEPDALMVNIGSQTDVSCFGGSDGSATVEASGGIPGYVYNWSTGDSGPTQTNLPGGTHIVQVVDSNFCIQSINILIQQPVAVSAILSSTDETGVNADDGTASAIPAGGTPGYTYMWSNGDTTPDITGLSPDQYCVTITDSNGCEYSECTIVNAFNCPPLFPDVQVTHIDCAGAANGVATVMINGGTDPITCLWSNGMSGSTVTGLEGGAYTVTCTDDSGCTVEANAFIMEPPALNLELLSQTNVECEGEMSGAACVAGFGGTPGLTFEWSNGNTTTCIQNVASGVYNVTVTDANQCTEELSVDILQVPDTIPPTVITQSVTLFLDENGMADLSPNMVDGGTFDNCQLDSLYINQEEFDCDDLGTNVVLLASLDASGNCGLDSVFVSVVDTLGPMLICPSDIVNSNCGTPTVYDMPIGTDNCSDVTPFLFDGIPSGGTFPTGTTMVTWGGTDNFGNPGFCSFFVTVQSDLAGAIAFEEPSCFNFEDGTATVTPVGGIAPFSFEWDDPLGQTTQTATDLLAGDYCCTITDAGACEAVVCTTVTQPDPITANIDEVINQMGQDANGAISITTAGGVGDISVEWFLNGSSISNDEDISNLVSGEYIYFLSDSTDCIVSDTVIVDFINSTITTNFEEKITLSPNPNNGIFHLDFDLPQSETVQISVFDFAGKEVLNEQSTVITKEKVYMNLSNAPAGVYLVRILIDDTMIGRRVVIQQ